MLLRALAVVGVILALARPMWYRSGSSGGLGRDVVFVFDVSMSMEREVEAGVTAFDKLLTKTESLLSQLGTRDTVRGIVTIGRGKWLGTDAAIAAKILGHSAEMNSRDYVEATDEASQRAIMAL